MKTIKREESSHVLDNTVISPVHDLTDGSFDSSISRNPIIVRKVHEQRETLNFWLFLFYHSAFRFDAADLEHIKVSIERRSRIIFVCQALILKCREKTLRNIKKTTKICEFQSVDVNGFDFGIGLFALLDISV